MTPRIKYALMFILALGSVAALAAVCRYPFIGYFSAQHNYLCKPPSETAFSRRGKSLSMLTMHFRQQRLDSSLVANRTCHWFGQWLAARHRQDVSFLRPAHEAV